MKPMLFILMDRKIPRLGDYPFTTSTSSSSNTALISIIIKGVVIMSKKKEVSRTKELEVMNPNAADIDIGSKSSLCLCSGKPR